MTRFLSPAREFTLKFFYPARSIYESFFSRIGRMGIHGYISDDNMMINPIDIFRLL